MLNLILSQDFLLVSGSSNTKRHHHHHSSKSPKALSTPAIMRKNNGKTYFL